MSDRAHRESSYGLLILCLRSAYLLLALAVSSCLYAQTGGTGAITGAVTDPAGALVVGAKIRVTNAATGDSRTSQSNDSGLYLVSLLPPGLYTLEVMKPGFKAFSSADVNIIVAETTVLNVQLTAGAVTETVTVTALAEQLETESSSLGRVTSAEMVSNLPLVTRNFTQIVGLNPGVSQEVNNAGIIGRGNGGQGGNPGGGSFLSQGGTSTDNNFQMNGLPVNDAQQTPTLSAGAPTPNPDTIQEFKVQTAQYDATTGRDAGANVDLITKGGTNDFHGSLFEYFRNEDLNANDWFASRSGQPRPILRQNQYGFTASGPLVNKKVLLFGSYQGTKQFNGLDPQCHAYVLLPPLTNDRSQAGLGAVFAGDYGYLGPYFGTINADGSNISPQALALFEAKLPNGQYVIPTPQQINPASPLEIQGSSFLSDPCHFTENQWMANGDYLQSDRSTISVRYFGALSNMEQNLHFDTPGFGLHLPERFDVASISHTYIVSPVAVNQFQIGFHRTTADTSYDKAFTYSALGIDAPAMANANPQILVYNDGFTMGADSATSFLQDEYNLADTFSYVKRNHRLTFGGGFAYGRDNLESFEFPGYMIPLTWADLLLGQGNIQVIPGVEFSNIFESINLNGETARDWRYKNADAFIQDDYSVTKRLTLNLGLRYEHIGDYGDAGGRMGNIYVGALNPNPPLTGSIQGYVVPSNFQGSVPAGVGRVNNTFGFNGDGQNTWNPRLGFAWQLPGSDRFVLRGGAGVYHTHIVGQLNLQLTTTPPFGIFNQLFGAANANASIAAPFPAAPTIPSFPAYSPLTDYTMWAIAPDFRPPTTYHYSLGLQSKLVADTILDVSYVAARDLHMVMSTSINQASLASPANPIRGVTTNTVANIPLRAPYLGWTTGSMRLFQTEGQAWYNALQTSLSRRFKNGLQFQAAYTWARFLTTEPGTTLGTNFSFQTGNQLNPHARYGPDPYIRPQRFVLSAFYALPGPANTNSLPAHVFGGWNVSTVTVVQSGQQLSIGYNNANNAYGITSDRASFAPGCTANNLATSGSVSQRVNNYINSSCLTSPAIIGSDGLATDFGNTANGVLRGPGQFDIDFSLGKSVSLKWPKEGAGIQFRADFFDLLNHPNFANPNLTFTTTPSAFGTITAMSSNPRVIQLALRVSF